MKKMQFDIPDNFDIDLDGIISQVLADPRIAKMLERNPSLRKHIENNPFIFRDWINNSNTCNKCPGLWACNNTPAGYMKSIEMTGSSVNSILKECRYKANAEASLQHRKKYLFCDLSERELGFDIKDIDLSKEEQNYTDVCNLVKDWIDKMPKQGLYLYGSFGVGKTYLAACITNSLAKKGVKVAFVNIPKFFAKARNSITADYNNPDNRDFLNNRIDSLQKAEVVVLDDIGAENTTNWVRDDILLPLLEYRWSNGKRTLFTSNVDMNQLETKLSFNQYGQKDEIKAGRILSRIKAMAIEVEVNGPDRR